MAWATGASAIVYGLELLEELDEVDDPLCSCANSNSRSRLLLILRAVSISSRLFLNPAEFGASLPVAIVSFRSQRQVPPHSKTPLLIFVNDDGCYLLATDYVQREEPVVIVFTRETYKI